ncbi:MAG: cobalamin-binding protein [Rhodospirillales bacterium]|nr:MAG: cobalamin-binding protein [Rhodospirillales bacterium]
MYPERIICLTAETVETLYLLGAQDRIAGVTGYAVRPPEVRHEKPKVGAFTSARVDSIRALEPDLVLTFSDLQADLAATLIRHGIEVHAFNQHTVAGILRMIMTLGSLVGAGDRAAALVRELEAGLAAARQRAADRARRPRVFFEEWDEPLISATAWVSELIELAGGVDVFADLAHQPAAKDRIVPWSTVVEAAPDIIIGSWCGKRFVPARVRARSDAEAVPAVRDGALHEVKSAIILQPGPGALTEGLAALEAIIAGRVEAA